MYKDIHEFFEKNRKAQNFSKFRLGKPIPLWEKIKILFESVLLDFPLHVVMNFPTSIGILLRTIYFKKATKSCGKNCIFGTGIKIEFPENLSLSEFVWIDDQVTIASAFGYVKIGKRVHVAPYTILSGGGGLEIEDYVGISSFVQIYSHSESPIRGKRISGPMIPEEYKGFKTKKVHISKDAFIGAGAIILPGVTVGEGAVVSANSVVTKDVAEWSIVRGNPAVLVGRRKKVNVPDI